MSGDGGPHGMVKVWKWILTGKASDDEDTANKARLASGFLNGGPPILLAIGGGQMARHGLLPIWAAVLVPLFLWIACVWYLGGGPEMKARALLRAESFQPDSIKARTDRLRKALLDADSLSRELEAALHVGNASLRRIEQQAADYKRVVNANKEDAQALARELGKDTVDALAKSNRSTFRWAAAFFFIGVAATLLVGVFARSLAL